MLLDEAKASIDASAESGTHDELVALDGVYASLWREQERATGGRLRGAAPGEGGR